MDIGYYDFNEHIGSVAWIYQLPSGLVHEKIDMRYHLVNITKQENGYQIYIGPKNSDTGGEAINIMLDKDYRLTDYVIERIEPMPENEQ
ncbi:hypothetical protein [Paraglaciecola hydrolytica]|uniref:Uncharacterized protein n=1 Tax=Paraglaciecola hydrolytica TaxID=1799789 RepID=A0A136A1Q7_9ALTE|nr:hypothetical protein [Paraglaciecola hydrolytica]KXI29133.1 hypothetical protein AX660_13325 [Paraglaciecola hydrolytica]